MLRPATPIREAGLSHSAETSCLPRPLLRGLRHRPARAAATFSTGIKPMKKLPRPISWRRQAKPVPRWQ